MGIVGMVGLTFDDTHMFLQNLQLCSIKSELHQNISMICQRGAFFGDWVHWSSLYAESNLDFVHLCCAGVTDAQVYQMVQN